jgi:excisionase family DNA binding protein
MKPKPEPLADTISVEEFRRALAVPRDLVNDALRAGRVRALRWGNTWIIPRSEVRRIQTEGGERIARFLGKIEP